MKEETDFSRAIICRAAVSCEPIRYNKMVPRITSGIALINTSHEGMKAIMISPTPAGISGNREAQPVAAITPGLKE